ncbi:MAG: hypothetical protein KH355_02320 [Clostridiales bacterium]|nr:hypothetical protein [Clostridiales bacterium]
MRYDIIYPGDEKKAAIETIKVFFTIWGGCIAVGLFVLVNAIGLYGTALAFTMIYIIQNEVISIFVEKQELKLLTHLDKYINELRKHYFDYGMVENALYEANESAKNEMQLHGKKIYEVVTSDEKEEEIILYNEQVPNRFLRILLAICSTTIDFGDKKMPNDETVFLFNLKELGKEIMIERLKREKKANVYMGTTFLTVFPIFSIPFIKSWAISNVEELYTWYNGISGIVVLSLLFILTIGVYNILGMMKDVASVDDSVHVVLEKIANLPVISRILNNLVQRNYGNTLRTQDLLKHSGNNITIKEFYVKKILTAIVCFILGFFLLFIAHNSVRQLQTEYFNNVTSLTSSTTDKQEEELKRLVKKYTNEYKDKKEIRSKKSEIINKMKSNTEIIKNEYVLELLSDEVIQRVITYQNQYVKWYEVVFVLVFTIVGYMIPQWSIIIKEKFVQMQMEDEVIQFQSIILMLIYLDRISTKTILTWMENFAVIFKDSIQTCLSNFPHGEDEALENLIEEERFVPFVRIIQNLQQADRVGIRKAFNEIAVDRQNYQEKRKQENEITLKNRGAIANFIAMIPLSATILFYLAYPFIFNGMQSLLKFTNDINVMM